LKATTIALALSFFFSFSARAAETTTPARPRWTPETVRNFVLKVERELGAMQRRLFTVAKLDERKPRVGVCYGDQAEAWTKAAEVLPTVRKYVGQPALTCYVATYFGCVIGDSIARAGMALAGAPDMKPFTRSKVTIVEQTQDRVVADVVEADNIEVDSEGVLRRNEDDATEGGSREYTDEELATFKHGSRYTITRGTDGSWRVSDRKPTWQWECRPR
jgi:hypothetical protein